MLKERKTSTGVTVYNWLVKDKEKRIKKFQWIIRKMLPGWNDLGPGLTAHCGELFLEKVLRLKDCAENWFVDESSKQVVDWKAVSVYFLFEAFIIPGLIPVIY